MLRQLVEHVGGRSDGVGTKVKSQSCLLSGSDKTVCCSLVTCDVHIASGFLGLRLHAIHVDGAGVGVVSVVPTGLDHLDISLCDGGLLGELIAQEVAHEVQVAVEEPADEAKGE